MYSSQASNKVFNYIVKQIHMNNWKAGMCIDTELQLCEKLNVSRTAVREAIEQLSAISVLKKIQGSGTYVNEFENCSLAGLVYYPPTQKTMITVLEFRRMFDSYNVELFIKNYTIKDMEQLETNYKNMNDAINDPGKFRFFDNEFHHIIAKGTHNSIIVQISALLTDLLASHQLALYQGAGPEHAIKYHGMILESIKEKKTELAYACSKAHIDNAINAVQNSI